MLWELPCFLIACILTCCTKATRRCSLGTVGAAIKHKGCTRDAIDSSQVSFRCVCKPCTHVRHILPAVVIYSSRRRSTNQEPKHDSENEVLHIQLDISPRWNIGMVMRECNHIQKKATDRESLHKRRPKPLRSSHWCVRLSRGSSRLPLPLARRRRLEQHQQLWPVWALLRHQIAWHTA